MPENHIEAFTLQGLFPIDQIIHIQGSTGIYKVTRHDYTKKLSYVVLVDQKKPPTPLKSSHNRIQHARLPRGAYTKDLQEVLGSYKKK